MSEAFSARTTHFNGSQIAPSDVASLLKEAQEKAHALSADIAKDARTLSERAACVAALGNLPPGVVTSLNEINKLLTEHQLKIDQQLEKNKKPSTPSVVAAAA